jgi:uracil-DNA glycosylase
MKENINQKKMENSQRSLDTTTLERLNFDTIEPRLGTWAKKLRPFVEGKEMWDIYQTLKQDRLRETIVPDSKDTFRAFSTTDISNVKVIFYLMDPYPKRYYGGDKKLQATGIAMDCSNSPNGKMQPSLEIWYDAMEKDLGRKVKRSLDLTYLHEQGVMMLNTDLTCKINKTASHKGLWEPFQKYFLEEVLGSDTHIIYVLCGVSSRRMERYINPFCKIFKLDHPMAAGRTHTEWDCDNIFLKINRILKDNNTQEIFWDREEWEEFKNPPF